MRSLYCSCAFFRECTIGLALSLLPFLATPASSQTRIYHWDGQNLKDVFGGAVAFAGDIDADGSPDLLISGGLSAKGAVYVYSGATGNLVTTFLGQGSEILGPCAGIGDLDGDGHDDVVLGAPSYDSGTNIAAGRASVYPGTGGSPFYVLDGEGWSDWFGSAVSGVGDLDADGTPDFLVAANSHPNYPPWNAGKVYAYSGRTGALLYSLLGESAWDRFGTALARVGDVDADGNDDFAVGSLFDDYGRVYLYSGASGTLLRTWTGTSSEGLGYTLSAIGDLDKDGTTDLVAGGSGSGRVFVFSCRTGATLLTVTGDVKDQFAQSLTGVGDANADGWPDFVVGAQNDSSQAPSQGSATLYSGRTGTVLYQFHGETANDRFATALAPAGDVNQDGFPDFIAGAPAHDVNGDWKGGAYVFAGNDLYLQATVTTGSGSTRKLALDTRGGPPGAPVLLFLLQVNGASSTTRVQSGRLDANGEWSLPWTVPPLYWGATLAFQSLALAPGTSPHHPNVLDSAIEVVTIPP